MVNRSDISLGWSGVVDVPGCSGFCLVVVVVVVEFVVFTVVLFVVVVVGCTVVVGIAPEGTEGDSVDDISTGSHKQGPKVFFRITGNPGF